MKCLELAYRVLCQPLSEVRRKRILVANTALEISPELENLPAGDSVELGLSHGSRSVRRSSVIDPSLGERAFVIEPVEYRHVHARGLQSRITVTADSSRAPGKAAAGNTRG